METIEDIVREMRNMERHTVGGIVPVNPRSLADRIEAAVEYTLAVEKAKAAGEGYAAGKQSVKDAEPVGNAAAMREALRKCANYLDVGDAGLCKGECDALREVMQEALSAPPRNCDLYTKDEVRLAYHLHGDGLMTMQAFSDWLFAEAKGENK